MVEIFKPAHRDGVRAVHWLVSGVSVAGLLLTIYAAWSYASSAPSPTVELFCTDFSRRGVELFFLLVWTVAPPAWFFLEYFFIFKPFGKPNHFEEFKHGQQLSAAIWAGLLLFLFATHQMLQKP